MRLKGVKIMSKLAKFFIICAAVCVLGIVMTFAGYAAGGWDNMEKVADNHEWLNVGPESAEVETIEVGEFKSIEAEGSMDIAIVSPGDDADFPEGPDFLKNIYDDGVAGTVAVKGAKGSVLPEVTNENGVLKIKGSTESIDHVEINLNGNDPSPDVVVFCSDEELESININGKYGDVAIAGVNAKSITATVESGDIDIEELTCGEITVETETGDIETSSVTGSKMELKTNTGDIEINGGVGEISAATNVGNIEFNSSLPKSQYEISVAAGTGTISIGENEIETENEFSLPGGPNKLTFKTTTGDIDVDFEED